MSRSSLAALLASALLSRPGAANADVSPPPPSPRQNFGFVQYGAALAVEVLTSAGNTCPDSLFTPCIFGSGGGLKVGVGYRTSGSWYWGGSYEFSKHDANKLLRVPLLQQARFEARYYFETRRAYSPYVTFGAGGAGYGSNWGVSTFGPLAFVGLGIEFQLSRTSVVGVAMTYDPMRFKSWQDPADIVRPAGIVSFLGIDLILEQRNPIGQ